MTKTEAQEAMKDTLRVEAGMGEDHDIGVIHEVKADKAFVGWESGVSTWTPIRDLCAV